MGAVEVRRDGPVYRLVRDGEALTWLEVAGGLQADTELRSVITGAIADSAHPALFWETVAVSRETAGTTPFAFVLEPSPTLARVPTDTRAFSAELAGPEPVATFPNLSGDALLVAPRRISEPDCYTHLARFVRSAPQQQVHALWAAVGSAVEQWWNRRPNPVWVSTSGLGVFWLHVRLDSRPKYYTYAPFRRPAS